MTPSKVNQYDIQTTTYKTAGTASAYTLTIPKLTSLVDEFTFMVEFHIENDASATLNINSLGAIAIMTSEGNAVDAGDLKTTGRYTLVYDDDTTSFIVSEMVDSELEVGGGSVSDEAYNESTWDGVTDVAPSKNAVRDKIESLENEVGLLGGKIIGGSTFNAIGIPLNYMTGPRTAEYITQKTGTYKISIGNGVNVNTTVYINDVVTHYSSLNGTTIDRLLNQGDVLKFYQERDDAGSQNFPAISVNFSFDYTGLFQPI